MRALTRRGRLTATLVLIATGVSAFLTWGWRSPGAVFATVLAAELVAVGIACTVDELAQRRRKVA